MLSHPPNLSPSHHLRRASGMVAIWGVRSDLDDRRTPAENNCFPTAAFFLSGEAIKLNMRSDHEFLNPFYHCSGDAGRFDRRRMKNSAFPPSS